MASTTVASRIFLLVLTIFLGWFHTNAQSLKLGPKVGALYLVSTESGNGTQDIYTKQKHGFRFGPWVPSFGMEFRYSPPRGRLTFAADASYSRMTGNGTISWVSSYGGGSEEGDFKSNLYVVSAGAQWDLLSGPSRPYLGLRVLWTHMTDVKQELSEIPLYGFDHFGVGLVGGATVDLTSLLALDVSARYNFTSISDPGDANACFNDLQIGVGLLFEVL
jgi:hypothetical protein